MTFQVGDSVQYHPVGVPWSKIALVREVRLDGWIRIAYLNPGRNGVETMHVEPTSLSPAPAGHPDRVRIDTFITFA